MVGTVKAMCILTLAAAMIGSVANAATVGDIVKQFKEFGPRYVHYREMENGPAKDAVFQELLATVKTNKWNTFQLGSIDTETFTFDGSCSFFSQFKVIYTSFSQNGDDRLRGIVPSSLYKATQIEHSNDSRLQEIEEFVKSKYASVYGKKKNEVAYHYEFFNGQDLNEKENPDARKEYMLILLAMATE